MKILYFVNHPISNNDGVVKKVRSQIDFFERNGAETKVLAFSENGKPSEVLNACVIRTSALKSRLLLYTKAVKYVREFKPDVIYARYDTFIFTQWVLKFIFGFKIIFEINTYDISEAKLLYKRTNSSKELLKYVIYLMTRKIWLNMISDGVIFVTADLENKYRKVINAKVPRIAIPNSLDFKMLMGYKGKIVTRRELFFIGTPNQPWHGVDKLVSLSERLPEFRFNIVGSQGDDTGNLVYHGYMSFDEYINIYEKCFACIGPLAIDRYGLKQSSPLKVREYIALGKPVIFGYDDYPLSDINSINFCRLSEFEENWADEIRSFYRTHESMEPYNDLVESLVDSNVVENKRFEFLRTFI